MPITSSVAWDGRLEAYKGRDPAHYIEMVKTAARRCAAYRLPLASGAATSLTVDITEGRDLEGIPSLTFDAAVCHLTCQEPGLRVHQATGVMQGPFSFGVRMVLSRGSVEKKNVPVLAYTLVPNMVLGEPGGEITSALVSLLLNHGFQMSPSASYTEKFCSARSLRGTRVPAPWGTEE